MPFRSLCLLLVLFASATPFYNVPAVGLPAYLEDADTDFTRSTLEPLGRHLFPRVAISETKALPDTAESISKYDAVLIGAPQMHDVLKSAQGINPDLLIFRKFNAGGYVGFKEKDKCADPHGVPFGWRAFATADCGFFAGHWVYYAGTLLSESIGTDSITFSVADASRITAGRYVVIYDHPAGSFRNAEHALVSAVSGNRVTLAGRGFKSIPRTHSAGSIIAEHPVAGNVDGETESLHWMYNMSSVAPQDSNGRRTYEVMANWLGSNVQRDKNGDLSDLRIDGVIFDTDSWSVAWRNRIDVNNDLIPDGGWDSTTGTNLWGEGFEEFYRLVRVALPDLMVSGGTRGVRGFSFLNGTQLEGWPVSSSFIAANPAYLTFDGWLAEYTLQLREGHRDTPAYTENLSKTPTRLYPRGTVPAPPNNAPFRFAFATTLLDNGYYAQEPRRDTPDPWWDEFAVDVAAGSPTYGVAVARNPLDETAARIHGGWLGMPLGPRQRVVDAGKFTRDLSLIADGGIDTTQSLSGWRANNVSLSIDFGEAMAGAGSMRVSKHLQYAVQPFEASAQSPAVELRAGVRYTLAFSARAHELRSIMVAAGGVSNEFVIPDRWVRRVMTFTASSSGQSRINFNVGRENTPIWLDEIYLFEGDASVFRRDFDNGVVVVNATPEAQSLSLGGRYLRIAGTGQDPMNNGEELDNVTIPPYDAAIMVKANTRDLVPILTAADISVGEGDREAIFTVTRTPAVGVQSTVSYSTRDGTALAGEDYLPRAGTITFAPGDERALIAVPIIDDTLPEPIETFWLDLFRPSGATVGTPTARAAIVDNDGPVGDVRCGSPSYSPAVQSGAFIWQDCTTKHWHFRVSGGAAPDLVSYAGDISSSDPFMMAEGVLLELPWDVVDTSDARLISFKLDVVSGGVDGIDFALQGDANVCLNLTGPVGVQVFGGPDQVPLPNRVNLATWSECDTSHAGNICGDPKFSSATDTGVFIYRTCEDPDTWKLRFAAAGQEIRYEGSLSASSFFTGMTGVAQESDDELSPNPFTVPTSGPIRFVQNVKGPWFDGIDVTIPSGSNLCFDLENPAEVPVVVGANRILVGPSVNPETLSICSPN